MTGKDHVDRQKEEQGTARDTKGGNADREDRQQAVAQKKEDQQNNRRERGAADRHLALIYLGFITRQSDEDWRNTYRVDDDE